MNQRIRARIRDEMDRQCITQAELARKLGIKPPSLAQVLSGKRATMPDSLMNILDALDLEIKVVQKGGEQ